MSKIYRVENALGIGPYHNFRDYRKVWAKSNHEDKKHHPLAEEEGLFGLDDVNFHHKEWHYGFLDMIQLNAWFAPSELLSLKLLGYSIKVYDNIPPNHVIIGAKQILFKKSMREHE